MITLPNTPGPAAVAWRVIDFGGTLQGALGGANQRVNRLGNRWACEVTLPPMPPEDARIWASALVRGLREGVRWTISQVGTPTGTPGTVLVAGGAQAGDALDVDGGVPGYSVRAGQFLSILTGGQRYLHQAAANTKLGSGGAGTLTLDAPLRVSPADNSPVELGRPVIEGLLADVPGWRLDVDRVARGFTFTIEETR